MSTLDEAVTLYGRLNPLAEQPVADSTFLLNRLTWSHYPVETVLLAHSIHQTLSVRTFSDKPGVTAPAYRKLTSPTALGLAVAMVNAEVARPSDGENTETMSGHITQALRGVYASAQRAALDAVAQLGGPPKVPITGWMRDALADEETWTVCEHVLVPVAQACAVTNPGRSWTLVIELGYVLYEPR